LCRPVAQWFLDAAMLAGALKLFRIMKWKWRV
jgi:hypothetical protein